MPLYFIEKWEKIDASTVQPKQEAIRSNQGNFSQEEKKEVMNTVDASSTNKNDNSRPGIWIEGGIHARG